MHRFRVNFCGSDAELARATQALKQLGGAAIGSREPSSWVWESDLGVAAIEAFSREHPGLLMSIEGFEDFRDEIVTAMVIDGKTSLLDTRGVLPAGWGSFHDEDGQALAEDVLRRAGAVVAERGWDVRQSTFFSGLETAMTTGEEIGRLIADTRDFLAADAPTDQAFEAITRLAQVGLHVSAASRSRTRGELQYLLPLRLTQAVVHAGHDEYHETPGNADWQSWLGLLLSSACELVSEAHMCDVVPPGPDPALSPGLDWRDPGETMELAARSLVTTCVQALALFDSRVFVEH